VASLPELRRLLAQESFDAIHAHGRGPLFLAMLATVVLRRRVLFTNHAYARMGLLYRVAAKWPLLRTALLTPNMARHYRIEAPSSKVSLVSECCSDRCFARALAVRRELAAAPIVNFVGVGNILRWKNWHLLIQAIVACPSQVRDRIRIEIVGPVTQDVESRKYADELNRAIAAGSLTDTVKLTGPTNDVPGVVTGADWFVIPSTNEPCSVALIEALAMGVPVIASRSGGNIDIIQEGQTGLLFRPDDPLDLARCITQIATEHLGIPSPADLRESVRSRSATAVARLYFDVYREMAREAVSS
jgi:glycosyltransferase involved in cell wall biosynthesis